MRFPVRKKMIAVAAVIVLVLVAVAYLARSQRTMEKMFKEDYAAFRSIQIGMSEEQVKNILGEPNKILNKSTAPKNYYVQGYAYKEREIGNKVFIYIRNEPIAYVYFDDRNRVEDVFVGGS